MDLQVGDRVRTDTGLPGQIVHITRLSAFVELELADGKELLPFLLSELIRIDPPHDEGPS